MIDQERIAERIAGVSPEQKAVTAGIKALFKRLGIPIRIKSSSGKGDWVEVRMKEGTLPESIREVAAKVLGLSSTDAGNVRPRYMAMMPDEWQAVIDKGKTVTAGERVAGQFKEYAAATRMMKNK